MSDIREHGRSTGAEGLYDLCGCKERVYVLYTPDMTISHKHEHNFFTNRYHSDFVQFLPFLWDCERKHTLQNPLYLLRFLAYASFQKNLIRIGDRIGKALILLGFMDIRRPKNVLILVQNAA